MCPQVISRAQNDVLLGSSSGGFFDQIIDEASACNEMLVQAGRQFFTQPDAKLMTHQLDKPSAYYKSICIRIVYDAFVGFSQCFDQTLFGHSLSRAVFSKN